MPAFIHVLGPMLASTNPRTLLMMQESGAFDSFWYYVNAVEADPLASPYTDIRHSPIWERAETASELFETGLGVKKNCGALTFLRCPIPWPQNRERNPKLADIYRKKHASASP
jgi:hypothetical protein